MLNHLLTGLLNLIESVPSSVLKHIRSGHRAPVTAGEGYPKLLVPPLNHHISMQDDHNLIAVKRQSEIICGHVFVCLIQA